MIHYLRLTVGYTVFQGDDSPLVQTKYHKTLLKLTLNSFSCIYQARKTLLRQIFTGGRKIATYL